MYLSSKIALLCEGSCEEAIMNILLDHHCLIFEKCNLIDEKPLRVRSAKNFESTYLRKTFLEKISVIRVLDSKNENFKLGKAYEHKVDVVNVITAPEIEILVIINEGKYDQYIKSRKKPSQFCIENLKLVNVKQYNFILNYFADVDSLINSISLYHSIHKHKDSYTLKSLLKNCFK